MTNSWDTTRPSKPFTGAARLFLHARSREPVVHMIFRYRVGGSVKVGPDPMRGRGEPACRNSLCRDDRPQRHHLPLVHCSLLRSCKCRSPSFGVQGKLLLWGFSGQKGQAAARCWCFHGRVDRWRVRSALLPKRSRKGAQRRWVSARLCTMVHRRWMNLGLFSQECEVKMCERALDLGITDYAAAQCDESAKHSARCQLSAPTLYR